MQATPHPFANEPRKPAAARLQAMLDHSSATIASAEERMAKLEAHIAQARTRGMDTTGGEELVRTMHADIAAIHEQREAVMRMLAAIERARKARE